MQFLWVAPFYLIYIFIFHFHLSFNISTTFCNIFRRGLPGFEVGLCSSFTFYGFLTVIIKSVQQLIYQSCFLPFSLTLTYVTWVQRLFFRLFRTTFTTALRYDIDLYFLTLSRLCGDIGVFCGNGAFYPKNISLGTVSTWS